MKIKWRMAGFRELRTSPGVQADIDRRARAVADAAGEGFEAFPTEAPRNRARAAVVAVSYAARERNAQDQTLIKSLDAGR